MFICEELLIHHFNIVKANPFGPAFKLFSADAVYKFEWFKAVDSLCLICCFSASQPGSGSGIRRR